MSAVALAMASVVLAGTSGRPLVVLDPGHGGEQLGALGACGLMEKDLVLGLGLEVERLLLATEKVRVVLTRRDDVDVDLEQRSKLANELDADLFLSIHANASINPVPRGIETYFLSRHASDARALAVAERENLGQAAVALDSADPVDRILESLSLNASHAASQRLALVVQGRMAARLDDRGRGVLQAPFVVLHHARMAAALVEVGFVSNAEECDLLADASYQKTISRALAEAILAHVASEQRMVARR